ncbi:MAG: aminodeoxychorismate lyase [Clostridiales bacterium]|nr:aminodeoxychorismate lyase [Roseburia sp.]MDD7635526.1 aminodeoxychorismate lyase [Clostridiales bacterium]MDY4111488.1 aminodeoxychorismate lyase [Roseburia sp.]
MKLNKVIFKFVSLSFSILVMLLVVLGLVELGSFCYDFGYRVFTETPVDEEPGRDVVVQVTSDMSESEIGDMLEEAGLVRDGKLFYAQLKLSAYSGDLLPGIYTLNTAMTGKDMIVVMATGTEESTEQ